LTKRYRRVSDWAYFFGVAPLSAALPRKLGYSLMRRQARHIGRANSARRQDMTRNISMTLDDEQWSALAKAETAFRTFETVATEDLETFCFPFWNERSIGRYYTFEGFEKIDRARSLRRGALLFTGRLGSLSSALVALAVHGYPCSHVTHDAPPEAPQALDAHPAFCAFESLQRQWMRKRMGRDPLYVDPVQESYLPTSATPAVIEVYRLLARNEIVSMSIDTPPLGIRNGAKVKFLGRECLFPTILVNIAHRSKAPVLPVFALRDPQEFWRQTIVVQEPVQMTGEVEEDLQRCVDSLAEVVLEHPEQWGGWDSLHLLWTESLDLAESAA
jgi:lauroyl/myristoyl acyltransferase